MSSDLLAENSYCKTRSTNSQPYFTALFLSWWTLKLISTWWIQHWKLYTYATKSVAAFCVLHFCINYMIFCRTLYHTWHHWLQSFRRIPLKQRIKKYLRTLFCCFFTDTSILCVHHIPFNSHLYTDILRNKGNRGQFMILMGRMYIWKRHLLSFSKDIVPKKDQDYHF